jgi:hypothetical protein
MSTGELYAWRYGVDWGRAGNLTPAILAGPAWRLRAAIGDQGMVLRSQIGVDVFGYWFRRGVEDYVESVWS